MNDKPDHPKFIFNPILLLVLAMILTWLLGWWIPLPFLPKTLSQITGALLFIGGILFGLPAFRGMLKAGTTPDPRRPVTALVLDRSFRITRNPMYLHMVMAYLGLFIFLQNAWFILILPLLVWLMTIWVIIPEERYLEARFGEQYLDFKARVRRWL